MAGHKHETWTRESLGINQVELDGPQKIGCAALEVGPDALRIRIYQAAEGRLWDEITVTPDGRMRGGGQFDQREVEKRPDVLSYTGAELAADLEVIGEVEAELKLGSTAGA